MRYRLRTLLIVLALGPLVLACGWWTWQRWQARGAAAKEREAAFSFYLGIAR